MADTMMLEELRTYLADMETEDVAVINAALDAAIRERDALRHFVKVNVDIGHIADTYHNEYDAMRKRAEKAGAELANMRWDKLDNEARLAEANERADAAGDRADSAEAKANSWMNQARRFESELDALKKRISESPAVFLCYAGGHWHDAPNAVMVQARVPDDSWLDKRVRLLVEADDV